MGVKSHAYPIIKIRDFRMSEDTSRSNKAALATAKSLGTWGIPTVIRGIGLGKTPEVALALACYRRLLDTGDSLATAEILCLYDCQSTEDWLDDRLKYVAEKADSSDDEWLMQGVDAHPIIAELAKQSGQLEYLSPIEALDCAILAGDIETAILSPSAAEPQLGSTISKSVRFDRRITLSSTADMQTLGHVVHGAIAAELLNKNAPGNEKMIDGIIERYSANNMISTADIVDIIKEFRAFLAKEFIFTACYPEYPIQFVNPAGQLVTGWIDLVLDSPDGWIIIDHKTFPGRTDQWEEKALSYSGQLKTYAEALELGTNKKVIGTWIHFPVGGGMTKVELP